MGREKGMTLVEVMVAVFIISLGLVTMLSMFDVGLATTSQAEKDTRALFLAQQKLEEAKNLINRGQYFALAGEDLENPEYTYLYDISGPDSYGIWQIIVTVSYDDKNVVLMTRLGERKNDQE